MRLFVRNHERDVQGFILHLVNRNCPELRTADEGPRLERRTNLTVPVLVVPLVEREPMLDQAFATVTKEFAATGVSLVLGELHTLDEAVLVFQHGGKTTFLRAKARHLSPMGAGFFQLGMRLISILTPSDYPGLAELADRF
ncbi:MAG: hypothetical protein JW818_22775 [Pirellulales bacterium]|nr:hypothetical protein [Pirellulales bacterium]